MMDSDFRSATRTIRPSAILLLVGMALLSACNGVFGQTGAAVAPGTPLWLRWRIDRPETLRYWAKVVCVVDPYANKVETVGSVNHKGLAKEAQRLPDDQPQDLLAAGELSAWVPLPGSKAQTWHTDIIIAPKKVQLPEGTPIHIELATAASADRVIHAVDEPLETGRGGTLAVMLRMPEEEEPDNRSVESFSEWADRRLKAVRAMGLGPPPHLTDLRVATYLSMSSQPTGILGFRQRLDKELSILEDVGVNEVMLDGVRDADFQALAKEHGILGTSLAAWADLWHSSEEGRKHQYDWQEGERPEQHWRRVFGDYYHRRADILKDRLPYSVSVASLINLGDEINPSTTADEIAKTPQILAYFRDWLRQQNVTPDSLGTRSWEEVLPSEDRGRASGAAGAVGDAASAHVFYWTRRFIDQYTVMYYSLATEAARQYFPASRMVTANYQAGPIQLGFMGNANTLNKEFDVLEMGRQHAMEGVMMEDWLDRTDVSSGRIAFGAEFMRAAARKHDLPLASYLVGWGVPSKLYPFLMHGVKETMLYQYGPVRTIGPAWGGSRRALQQTAQVLRDVKRAEDLIAGGQPRPRRAALLVASTSDIMQLKGLYYAPERQNLFLALQHAYYPVDVVSEQEILEDGILKNYSLLYVTDPQLRTGTQQRIAEWVQGGGKLWAEVGAACWDEYNRPSGVLNPVLGVGSRQMVTQTDWRAQSSTFHRSFASRFPFTSMGTIRGTAAPLGTVHLPAWGAKLECQVSTGTAVGTYEDGKPAAVLNRYGKGEALLVGALVGEAYVRMHYPDNNGDPGADLSAGADAQRAAAAFLSGLGITRPVYLSTPGIYAALLEGPRGSVVMIENPSGKSPGRVSVHVRTAARVAEVTSAKRGKLAFDNRNGEVTVDLPLEEADIISLRP